MNPKTIVAVILTIGGIAMLLVGKRNLYRGATR